ncbi:major facilitator superfamily domain-containing protein [Dioszegia hungarica]|uniref:Major facilitator superfamily domain-containing protein n=1 Tax=Dioszegia hungarica TaxID=4972 RepID=A0AA38H107_9TREE|nr:major facilitator superfamily domain-containing protein [Dioszegia hungarica]KAI9631747.1 major facilitator superfamily domain-containing protein [Dioszegia hungarica]
MSTNIDNKADIAHLERGDSGNLEYNKTEHAQVQVEDAVAAEFVDPTVTISPEENLRLRKIIYKKLLPIMCIAYVTQSLDKGTLGTSSIMGWIQDVNAQGQDYALTSTMLWIGIIVGEPLVNQCIRKYPVAKVLGGSMVVWSLLVVGLAFALSIPPVLAIRFLLGFFESSFSPCLMAITVQWFTVDEQTYITTIWTAMFAVAGVTANLLGYGFYHVLGANPLRGWQIMTVVIAIISLAASAICLWGIPDTVAQARFASPSDKILFVERVRANDQGIKQKVFKKDQARESWTDPLTWSLCIMIFLQTLVVGGFNTFNSILINGAFGFDVKTSLLVSIPLSIFQVCLYFLAAFLGNRYKNTIYVMIGYTCTNIIGTVVLLTVAPTESTRIGLLIAFYVMQCFQSCHPSMYVMLSRNVAGQTKKSIVYAAFFVAWAVGNAIGPQIFQAAWKPRYYNSLYIHLGIYGLFIANLVWMRVMLTRRNAKREKDLLDQGLENNHSKAFDDMTDLQNQDFRYSV